MNRPATPSLHVVPALTAAFTLLAGLAALSPPALGRAPQSTTTIEVRVSTPNDDAEERAAGDIKLKSRDLDFVAGSGGSQTVGMRFQGVQIPAGSTVQNAWIQFRAATATSGATSLTLRGELAASAAPFVNSTNNLSARARTNATVSWSPAPWTSAGAAGAAQRTPNLTSLVQEIVSRPGWARGNALVVLATGSGLRIAEAYDGLATGAALLHVDYTTAANLPPTVDAGPDQQITLPNASVALDATVTDDLATGTLTTQWSQAGGTGLGTVTFANPAMVDTTATFTQHVGTYVLRLTADDGQFTVWDELTVTVDATGTLSLERRVSAGADDAEERSNGSVVLTSSDLELVYDAGGNQTVGLRFRDVTIPQGATILTAHVQFTVDESTSEATALTLRGQAADNAPPFTSASANLSSRATTGTSVLWNPAPWPTVGAAGSAQRTPELALVVQQIVDRPGWQSGNALVLLITGTGERVARAFDGVPAAAPLLRLEYALGTATNQPPVVDAGPDRALTLPMNTLFIDASVVDDGASGMLVTQWSHVGGSGTGTVSFGSPFAVDTNVTFGAAPGTYVLRLVADDGQFVVSDDMVVTLSPAGTGTNVVGVVLGPRFATGFVNGNPLTVPSIDPASLVYHTPSGRLFIADSEINEVPSVFSVVQANVFETSLTCDTLYRTHDLTQSPGNAFNNLEPTGIAFNAADGAFYVTNDDNRKLYRYAYDGTTLTPLATISTQPWTVDPEDVACDPATGRLYVIGGSDKKLVVFRHQNGFAFEAAFDLNLTAGTAIGIPRDPEGIAFDPLSGHLFIVSGPERAIFEFTVEGVFVQRFSVNDYALRPIALQGITIAPSSGDPTSQSFYMTDGGIDNDQDPNERDGAVYEARIVRGE